MNYSAFFRQLAVNFIGAMIITALISWAMSTTGFGDLIYLGALIGLLVFCVFGLNTLVDEHLIEDNMYRLLLAVFCIAVYDIAFVLLMPLLFGEGILMISHSLAGFGLDVVLDSTMYLAIFSLIVFLINLKSCMN